MTPRLDNHPQGRRDFEKVNVLCGIFYGIYLAFLPPSSCALAGTQQRQKDVLILYSFENEVGLYTDFDEALRATLRDRGPGPIRFYTEFLDLARFPNPVHEKKLEDLLRAKYSTEKIDLIFAVSLPAINFVLSHGEEIFPGVPTVFCAVDRRWIVHLPLPLDTTGIVETTKINQTLAAALQLQPDTRRVVVVGGTLPYERDWMLEIRSDLREYEGKLDFTYLTDLPMAEILQRLAHLPEHTIVLYMMMWRDGAGEEFLPKEALRRIADASSAPVYGVFQSFLGTGMVGGDLVPLKIVGSLAAEMGVHVLKGERPADIPMLSEDNATYVFDWRQLRRWNISENRLPPGSTVLFKQPSAWEQYKGRIIGLTLLIAAEAVLIALLFAQRRKRSRAEAGLQKSEARYLAFVGNSSEGISRFEADAPMLLSLSEDEQYEFMLEHAYLAECNDAFAHMYSVATPQEFVGAPLADVLPPSEPQNVETLRAFIRSHYRLRDYLTQDRDPQGNMRWFESSATGAIEDGCLVRAWIVQREVTEQRLMHEEILKAAEEWQSTFESIEDMVMIVDRHLRVIRVNKASHPLFDVADEEIVGKKCYVTLHATDCPLKDCPVLKTFITNRPEEMEFFDEQRKSWYLISAHPVRDDQGNVEAAVHIIKDITERKRAQQALQTSEKRYRDLVESSHDWVWEVDSHGVYTYASPQCRDLLGYEPEELIGKRPFDLMPPEEARRVSLAFAEIEGKPRRFRALEKLNLHKQGRLVVLETNGVPVFDEHSKFCGYRGMDRDITKRKQAEDELRESERKYRQLHESMIDGFVRCDMDGRITEFNDAYCKLVGYEPHELVKLPYTDLIPEKWHAVEADIIERQVMVQGHSDVHEKEYRRKDGQIIPVELRTYLMRDEAGNPCGTWAIVREISERKRAERALQEYENAVESSHNMIAVVNREYRYLIANRAYLDHMGMQRTQVVGHLASEVLGHEFFDGVVKKKLDECFAGNVVQYETKHSSAKLGERDLNVSYFPIESSGSIERVCCVIEDITERKDVQDALHKAEAQYHEIFENSLEGIYRTSPEGKILACNPALARMLGYSSAQELASTVGNLGDQVWVNAEDRRALLKLLEETGHVRGYEAALKRKDGTKIWGCLFSRKVCGPNGKTLWYEGFVEDITERKLAEEALRERSAFDELTMEILSRFASCPETEVDANVAKALQAIAEFIGADHAFVIQFSTDGASWSATHEWRGPSVIPKMHAFKHIPMATTPRNIERLRAGQVIRITTPEDSSLDADEERRLQKAEGFCSALTVPLMFKGRFGKCVELHSHARRLTWSEDDVARVRLVGDAVGTALGRKQSLEELRKSEEKFSKAFHASPVAMTILSLATGRYIEVNKAYEENFGFRATEIIGRTSEELGVYVNPGDVEKITRSTTQQEQFRGLETLYRTKSGEIRTVLLSSELIEFGGGPCSLRVIEDITERKRIEQASREIGARMLMVQEEERRRVARELHDDFSQRLALLAIDLEQLAHQPPAKRQDWTARIQSMWSQTQELTTDLHRLSYKLHPSKLEDLGLIAAVRSYCRELSAQAGLEVKFVNVNVPEALSKEISLCIYRVVQEALGNVVKHSGVKSATVDLSGEVDEVRLIVSDQGRGFDAQAAREGGGLGLVSMQERVRHVGGKCSIDTRPSGGTRVMVRIPLPSRQVSAGAA